jgi:hypothetical protein
VGLIEVIASRRHRSPGGIGNVEPPDGMIVISRLNTTRLAANLINEQFSKATNSEKKEEGIATRKRTRTKYNTPLCFIIDSEPPLRGVGRIPRG